MSTDNLIELFHALEPADEPHCALCALASEVRKDAKSNDELRTVLGKKASQCTAEESDITAQIDLRSHAREKLQFELKKVEMAISDLEKKRKLVRQKRVLIQSAITKISEGTFGQYVTNTSMNASMMESGSVGGIGNALSQQPSSNATTVTPSSKAVSQTSTSPTPVAQPAQQQQSTQQQQSYNQPLPQQQQSNIPPSTVAAAQDPKRVETVLALLNDKTIKETHLQKGLNQFESYCLLSVGTTWEAREYPQYVEVTKVLINSVQTSQQRPPIQAIELRILNALLKRSTWNINQARSTSECRPSVHEVAISNDALNIIIKLFSSVNDEVKCEAAEVLTSLCVDVPTKDRAAQNGAVRALLTTLNRSNHEQLLERSLIALWHLAMSDANKALIRDSGGIQSIVELLSSDCHPIVENVTISLGYLTRDDNNKIMIRKCNGLEKLISTLYYPSETVQSTAAGALWNCASNADNKIAIRQLGGVAALVDLLTSPNESVQENAAGALWNLGVDTDNKKLILQLGGIQPLIQLLSSANEAVVENASGTLWNCAAVGENRIALRKMGGLEPLLRLLVSRNEHIQENAAGAIRNCAINDQNKVALKELGGIELFVDLLDRTKYTVLEKITSTLWICSINNDNKQVLRSCGGFPKLLRTLDNENLSIKEKALGILRNCSTLPENRVALIECNAIPKLVQVLSGNPSTLTAGIKEYAAATLWNIARDDKTIPREQGAIRVLAGLLNDRMEGVVENVAGALLSLTINADNRDHLRDVGGLQALVKCLEHSNEFILENVLGALKNCTASNERNQSSVRDLNAIPRIVELLSSTNESIVREAALCLKNLGANDENCELISRCHGVSTLIRLQETSDSDAIRKVASFALQTLNRGPHARRAQM